MDIQEALKGLPGGTIRSMREADPEEHMEGREEADPAYHDRKNISGIGGRSIAMSPRGMSVAQVPEQIKDTPFGGFVSGSLSTMIDSGNRQRA